MQRVIDECELEEKLMIATQTDYEVHSDFDIKELNAEERI
jgi:hypothetical protein